MCENQRGKNLNRREAARIIERLCPRARLKAPCSPMACASFATHLLEEGIETFTFSMVS